MNPRFDHSYIKLVIFSEDPRTAPEDRAMALAILDGIDDLRDEEISQVVREVRRKPTPEQRARFERRLEEELARIRAARECQN